MAEPDDKDALVEVMSPLVDGLYASLDRALELARQHFVEFDMTGAEYEATVRVVRPIGTWKWGQKAKLDIDVRLPRRADDLAGLEFVPSDELDVRLPFEEADVDEESDADDN